MLPSSDRRLQLTSAWAAGDKPRGMSAKTRQVAPDSPARKDEAVAALRQEAFVGLLSWVEDEGTEEYVGGEQNRLVSLRDNHSGPRVDPTCFSLRMPHTHYQISLSLMSKVSCATFTIRIYHGEVSLPKKRHKRIGLEQ